MAMCMSLHGFEAHVATSVRWVCRVCVFKLGLLEGWDLRETQEISRNVEKSEARQSRFSYY